MVNPRAVKVRIGPVVKEPRTITVREVIEAVRKNGIPQGKTTWWRKSGVSFSHNTYVEEEIVIGSACAMGQAAVNLGMHWKDLDNATFIRMDKGAGRHLNSIVMSLNDRDGLGCEEIAKRVEEIAFKDLDTPITIKQYRPVEIISED